MIVDTPVGAFPYKSVDVEFQGRQLAVNGELGAWPASITVGCRDLPAILRVAWLVMRAALASGVNGRKRSR